MDENKLFAMAGYSLFFAIVELLLVTECAANDKTCGMTSEALGNKLWISDRGDNFTCGEKHVIVVKDVPSNGGLLESVQKSCNNNHTCDFSCDCDIEYYCIQESFSTDCTQIKFGTRVNTDVKDNEKSIPKCYKSYGNEERIFCNLLPDRSDNRWMMLQSRKTDIPINSTTVKMENFTQYNYPKNADVYNLKLISFDCDTIVWFLHVTSDSCSGVFDDLFLDSQEQQDSSPLPENSGERNVTSMYSTLSDPVTVLTDNTTIRSFTSSLDVFLVVNTADYKADRMTISREFIYQVTGAVVGTLIVITLTVCLVIFIKRSRQKSVGEQQSKRPNGGLYGCTKISESFNSTSPNGENTYYVIEVDPNARFQRKVEENMYNSIDEILPNIPKEETRKKLYSHCKEEWLIPKKGFPSEIEDAYDHIVGKMVDGKVDYSCQARIKREKANESQLGSESWKPQPEPEDTTSNVLLSTSTEEEWPEPPNIQLLNGISGYYDRVLPKEPSAPELDTDSVSDPEAIYEKVDDLMTSSQCSNKSQPQDLYESVVDPPAGKGRYSTFLSARKKKIGEKPLEIVSSFPKTDSVPNTNSQTERIYDHLCDKWNDKTLASHHIGIDGYVYAHLGENTGLKANDTTEHITVPH